MFPWLIEKLLGKKIGKSGQRESAMFAFMLWVLGTCWVAWAEFSHTDPNLAITQSMWMVSTPLVWGWLGFAFGFGRSAHGEAPPRSDSETETETEEAR